MNKTVWNTLLNVIIAVASAILGACSLYLIDEVLAIILFYRLEMTDDIGDP